MASLAWVRWPQQNNPSICTAVNSATLPPSSLPPSSLARNLINFFLQLEKMHDSKLRKTITLARNIQMEKVSDSNPLPRTCDVSTATGKGAMKISVDEHHLILEEITRRGSLEDPNYDLAGSDSEDSDNNSDNSSGSEE